MEQREGGSGESSIKKNFIICSPDEILMMIRSSKFRNVGYVARNWKQGELEG
jgi:hypothetical protein